MALSKTLPQPPSQPEPSLEPGHLSCVPLVIIPEQMEEAVQSQNLEFGSDTMTLLHRLTPCNAPRDDDIAEKRIDAEGFTPAVTPPVGRWDGAGRERQDIGRRVPAAIRAVQAAHDLVANDGNRDLAAYPPGSNLPQPRAEAGRRPSRSIG